MSKSKSSALLMPLFSLMLGASAQAGINTWTVAGPEGGFTTAVTPSPHDPSLLLAATQGGTYRSVNGGATWQKVSTFQSAVNYAFSPTNAMQVCASNNNLYCSSDAGLTFTYMGNTRQTPGNGSREVWFSRDGTYLYAATNSPGRIYRTASMDVGLTWTDVSDATWPQTSNALATFTVDPNDANVLYVAFNGSGVYKTVNGGATWTLTGPGPGSGVFLVNQIMVRPGNSNRVVVVANDGLWVSVNGGTTWAHPYTFGARTAAIDPQSPDTVLAAAYNGSVLRSTNGGDAFTAVSFGLRSIYQPMRMQFDGGTPSRLLLGSGDGPMVSVDVGLNFAPLTSGIRAASLQALTSSDTGSVYAVFYPGPAGVYKRTSTGWQTVNHANLFATLNYELLFHDVATSAQNGNIVYVLANNDQIVKSTDGGDTWAPAGSPLLNGNRSLRFLAVDPANPDVAYVASWSANVSVYKTEDGGQSWVPRSTGLPTTGVTALTVDPNNSQVVYAGAIMGSSNVSKSVDGGLNWAPTGAMPLSFGVNDITVDPSDSRIVYAAVHTALFKSIDSGATWNIVGSTGTTAGPRGVHIDRVRPGTVTAGIATVQNGFMRSVDSGGSWEVFDWPAGAGNGNWLNSMLVDRLRPGLVITGGSGTGILEYEVAPDMAVTLDVPASIDIGATVNATVTVRNSAGPASSVSTLRFTVPAWLTPAPPAGCTLAGQVVTCTLPGLKVADGTLTRVIPLTASGMSSANSDVVAQLETREFDPDTQDNSVTVQAASVARADLGVAPVAGTRTAVRNAAVTLSLTASNAGPASAANARVTITIPAGITLTSSTTTAGSCTGTTQVVCALGAMANGANATITLNGTAVTSGNAAIDAAITSDTTDAVATNNTGSATFTITDPPPTGGTGGGGAAGGGGGGGGRFDWLLLALLGAVGWRRVLTRAE